jgi:hypothetical protein
MMTEVETTLNMHEQILVEFDLDGQVVALRAMVVNVLPAAIWLGLSRPDSLLEQVRGGQPISLTFRRGPTAFMGSSRFLGHLGSSRSRLFSVSPIEDVQTVQRRGHLRCEASGPIEYVIVSQSDSGVAGRTGRGSIRNISATGTLFEVEFDSENNVEIGDLLELTIAVGREAVTTDAEVVRVEAIPDSVPGGRKRLSHPSARLVAVRFEAISGGAEDKIVRHIFSLQRQRR